MLILGIDDAGRGPIIGPMILAGVLIDKSTDSAFKGKVKDSKLLVHSKRIELAKMIKEKANNFHVVKIYPNEIDSSIDSGTNLNTLEAMKMAEIINKLNDRKTEIKVIIDCPSVNISAWRLKLLEFVKYQDNLEVICEHKADFNHPSVSAASIIAKVEREEEVEKIRKKYAKYGDSGSGYPADPTTKEFLAKYGKELENEGIFRKSWQTWKTLFGEKSQATLDSF